MTGTLITSEYRALNARLHDERADYGTGGGRWAEQVLALARLYQASGTLDYGCGKGTLARMLPFPIQQYDPSVPAHSTLPSPADLVVCTDVLEHVEPELLPDVLDHLASLVKKAGFFVIACRPARKILPDGRNAHLIIQTPRWWVGQLWDRLNITQMQMAEDEVIIVATPQ